MRLLVMNDTGSSALRLKEWLLRYDFKIVAELASSEHLAQRVGELLPDALIVQTASMRQTLREQIITIHSRMPLPILMFTNDGRKETIDAALRSGVTSYLVGNVNLERLPVILRVAAARFEEAKVRRKELLNLKHEFDHQQALLSAKNILMKTRQCSENDAYHALRKNAMSHNMPISDIARQVVDLSRLLGIE